MWKETLHTIIVNEFSLLKHFDKHTGDGPGIDMYRVLGVVSARYEPFRGKQGRSVLMANVVVVWACSFSLSISVSCSAVTKRESEWGSQ